MFCAELFLFTVCLTAGALCRNQNATMPDFIEALGGSCVVIPCSFEVPSDIYVTGLEWTLYPDFGDKSYIDAVLLGDLELNNCTSQINNLKNDESGVLQFSTVILSDWIRIQYLSEVLIEVKDTPPEPLISPPTVNVSEGTTVNLYCYAPSPCPSLPPTLTWKPALGHSVEELKENTDKTKTMRSILTFTASRFDDGRIISCSARYERQSNQPDLTSESVTRLTVYFSSQTPSVEVIDPSGEVMEGSSVTLKCSYSSNPPTEEYVWYRVNGDQETLVWFKMIFTTQVTKHNSNFACGAINVDGIKKSPVIHLLSAQDPPRDTSVSISLSSLDPMGVSVILTCRTNSTSEVSYAWYKVRGGETIFITTEQSLTLPDTSNIGLICCEAQNHYGTDRSDVFLPVRVDTCVQDGKSATLLFIVCGLITVLWISSVVFGVYKYTRLSRRVAQGDAGEKTYATLQINNVSSEYSTIRRQEHGRQGVNRGQHVYENTAEERK